ncbi:hypothetical protein KSP40_PGU017199 [Platanthera guangdongensis]|uniref:Uncharacterized protein n=1 Tax=Platanthera guangdongensis TaxID=2320717 RepID=A0ABR2LQK9_9ASPA
MRDYTTPTVGSIYPGFGPAMTNQQFEIKPAILNIIRNNAQFSRMATEDAHLHLQNSPKFAPRSALRWNPRRKQSSSASSLFH